MDAKYIKYYTSNSTLLTGLMASFSCNESSNTTVYDSHTTNVDSTAQSFTSGTPGKLGNFLSFNGTSNYVQFGNACRPTSALSISLWLKASTQSAEKMLIHNNAYSTNWYGWRISLNAAGEISVILGNGAGTELDISYSDVDDNIWRHIAFTWGGTNAYIYVNNVKSSAYTGFSGQTIAYHSYCNLHLGSNEEHNASFYSGGLDLINIYSKELSDAEVSSLYNSGNAIDYPYS